MVKPFGIPPAEAIKLIKAKGFDLLPSFSWKDVWAETHAAAFTVAKSAGFNILGDVYQAVREAQEGKLTFKEFAAQLQPVLEKAGWWGRREVKDPETGAIVKAQLGSPRRLKTIYRTNIRQAEAAGQWARIQAVKKDRPYLRYVAAMDSKTRPEHRAWHGLILPVDHPFWNTHFPPNDWGCRCTTMPVSESDLKRYGWKVAAEIPDNGLEPWTNDRTGETLLIPQGVDPAFAHNAGQVAIEVHSARALGQTLAGLPPEVAAQATAASADFVARATAPALRDMFKSVFVDGLTQGRQIVAGALAPEVLGWLAARGITPQSGAIALSDKQLGHLMRDSKQARGAALSKADILNLTYNLARPQAILYDEAGGDLLYIFSSTGDDRQSKVVVRLDAPANWRRGVGEKRGRIRLTQIKTAGLVPADNLKHYQIIKGKV
ncbi:phage morphogenesis protein [Deltaproteobacteria bacterium]|nr:phage morphogenesis protein [Deltaproteobacteria bacterium]